MFTTQIHFFFLKIYKSITYYIQRNCSAVIQGKLFRQNRASNQIHNKKEHYSHLKRHMDRKMGVVKREFMSLLWSPNICHAIFFLFECVEI